MPPRQRKRNGSSDAPSPPPTQNTTEHDRGVRREDLDALLGDGEVSAMEAPAAVVTLGNVRPGFGLTVQVDGTLRNTVAMPSSTFAGTLDVHGSRIFSAFPYGLGTVAQMLLPLHVRLSSDITTFSRNDAFHTNFVLGAKQLSHARIREVLTSVKTNGDPPFVLELRGHDRQLLGFVPTKASLIEASLEHLPSGRNIRYDGPLHGCVRAKSKLFTWMWWLKLPVLFSAACWALLTNPVRVLQWAIPLLNTANASTITQVLPLCPTTLSASFKLGVLRERLVSILASVTSASGAAGTTLGADIASAADVVTTAASSPAVVEILHEAAEVVGKKAGTVTTESLLHVLDEIAKVEAAQSLVTRVGGFFTFVNTVWLLGVLGITVSIGPSVYHVLRPLRHMLERLIKWTFRRIIEPVVRRLHEWGIFETGIYMGCWSLVAEGVRMHYEHADSDAAVLVATTGALLCIPALAYSTLLWGGRLVRQMKKNTRTQLLASWLVVTWIPCAVGLQSVLFGYGAVSAAFVALGFGIAVGPLCLALGFEDVAAAYRVCFASFSLLLSFVAARIMNVTPAHMQPFSSAVAVMGSNMFFLSLLIIGSNGYRRDRDRHYWIANGCMGVSLLSFQLAGHVLGATGLANVSTVFTVLWLLERYAEFHLRRRFNSWLLILGASVVAWRGSLFLHMHPEYVVNLFHM